MQIEDLVTLLHDKGHENYAGEAVTQLQHALQCAQLAEAADAGDAMITAALLHDIGHLVHHLGEDCAADGINDAHEHRAEKLLSDMFCDAVVAPIRMHVDAKRYLCAVDSDYRAELSPASQLSLRLQGGPMDAAEAEAFRSHPYASQALMLRKWDDCGKDPDCSTPDPEHYVPCMQRCLRK